MRRWIAVFAVLALAVLVAAYIALFPLAPQGGALAPLLSRLDDTAANLVVRSGRELAVLTPLALGIILALLLAASAHRAGLAAARGARKRMPGGRKGNRPDPDAVWRPEPEPVEAEMDHVPGLERRAAGDAEAGTGTGAPVAAARTPAAPPLMPDLDDEPALPPIPGAIVLARKPRERTTSEQAWFDETSWLGGLPRLGTAAWPADERGPLPFAAQLDLAAIAAACPDSPLPRSGSLAFFLGSGAVIEVPGAPELFTEPPPGLPPAFDEGGHPLPAHAGPLSRAFFPFWPVEPLSMDLPGDTAPRSEGFTATQPAEHLWWHGAVHLADCLHMAHHSAAHAVATERERGTLAAARLARLEQDPTTSIEDLDEAGEALAACERQLPAILAEQASLAQVVTAMDGFVADRDPWTALNAEEIAVLGELLAHVQRDCPTLVRFYVPETLGELTTLSLRAMMTGDARAFAQVPAAELARINDQHRLAIGHQHQLFGIAAPRPRHAPPPDGDVLLLQLGCDDMMEWNWAHKGLFQFRLSARDMAERRWDRVTLTFLPE
ncbi:DUF1963 domain-containing protein [Novosphingobium clariflavum]|uniref:DUF1963 domain-containing protein n=1 Tax=Novosphingobium clariflavum TaxID=2029884 RepID=A0ABV6SEZ5_9SPHN|nr:DUF1963 domain-containing protein [Novosphingobium clariflavum]